jgi:hypothetical protein
MEWDVTRYAERLPKKPLKSGTKASNEREELLRRRYPPPKGVIASMPCIIVDVHGIIMAWYLLGILSDSRQVGLFALSDRSKNLIPLRMQCWQCEKSCARCWKSY